MRILYTFHGDSLLSERVFTREEIEKVLGPFPCRVTFSDEFDGLDINCIGCYVEIDRVIYSVEPVSGDFNWPCPEVLKRKDDLRSFSHCYVGKKSLPPRLVMSADSMMNARDMEGIRWVSVNGDCIDLCFTGTDGNMCIINGIHASCTDAYPIAAGGRESNIFVVLSDYSVLYPTVNRREKMWRDLLRDGARVHFGSLVDISKCRAIGMTRGRLYVIDRNDTLYAFNRSYYMHMIEIGKLNRVLSFSYAQKVLL